MHAVSTVTILRFLLAPEDTSVPAPGSCSTHVSCLWRRIKAFVWIAFSVAAALFLGNL